MTPALQYSSNSLFSATRVRLRKQLQVIFPSRR
jgi:hypothetical protein